MNRLAALLIAVSVAQALSVQMTFAACVDPPQRKIVYWTDYSRGDTAEYEAAFGHLRTVINKEISRLPYVLSQSALQSGEIAEMESEPAGADKPVPYALNGPAAHRAWWGRAQTMIGMFHGSVYSSAPLRVFSSLYSENMSLPMIANDPGIDIESDSQVLVDSHNLLIAYAVAMDAHKRGCSKTTVYSILERANEFARQLKGENQLNGDLEVVADAVKRRLYELAQQ